MHMLALIENIYDKNPHNSRICTKYIKLTEMIVKFGILLDLAIIFNVGFILQLLYNFIGGNAYPTFPLLIPGTDLETTIGCVLALMLQSLMIIISWIPLIGFDTMLAVIFVNFKMLADLLIERIDDLSTSQSTRDVQKKLYDIIWMQRRNNELNIFNPPPSRTSTHFITFFSILQSHQRIK